ncbi:MAG: glycosyltransferase family 4 protein [Alphaproteobacteria bacterium]|nr:glycosyltransferase family 4 protein [Alphaproteobacteria bacterium]
MRLTYLLPAPGIPVQGPSGASAHVRGLARGLRQDHDVDVVATHVEDHRGRFGDDLAQVHAVGVPRLPGFVGRELREVGAARRIARHLLDRGAAPDAIIERHSLYSDAGWRIHDALGIPWLLEVNAPALQERLRFERVEDPDRADRWQREVLRAAPTILAVSRWLCDWLRSELGCRDVRHVPNGVAGLVGDRDRGRALLGVPGEEPLIGFVGSMKPWHGIGRLPRVARAVGARLVLVGEARDPTTFLAEGEALPAGTIRTGHLRPQALADVVAALDLGLAPYGADAPPWFCPLKVLDYRAQGTPVVGTDVGDVALLTGDAGAVVPPGDDDALIDAARAWLGRRQEPHVRSWRQVGAEVIESLQPPVRPAPR